MADRPLSRAVKDFLGEAEEIIEKLNLDLVELGDAVERGGDPELLNGIFRGAHSIKGLAGMFGFDDISELAHHMENILDNLRLDRIPLTAALIDTLLDALEVLTHLANGKSAESGFSLDISPILERIEAVVGNEKAESTVVPLETLGIEPAILNVLTEYEEHRLLENVRKGRHLLRLRISLNLASFDQELAEITDQLKTRGEVISTLPGAGDLPDRISFQLLYGTESEIGQIEKLLDRPDATLDMLAAGRSAVSPPAPKPPVEPKLEPGLATAKPVVKEPTKATGGAKDDAGAMSSLRSISRTVRVDIDKLDSLMNIVGELVLSKSAVAALCDQLKNKGVAELASQLQKATRLLERRLGELQKGVMEVRMVPVLQLFEKVSRIVRRVAGEQGKMVALDIRGAETELDKLIVEDLADPLMHIVRNAIDHGVETPAEREASGKAQKATICLWAVQKGNHVVIEIHDDGRGIDPENVRRKAVQKGLVEDGVELSREAVVDLIMTPGFSTRDEVSELSGRGVGMDVVKSNIAALSGMIEVESRVGEGTSVAITLPITLAIIKALIVQVENKTYALPINSVLETLMMDTSSIRTIERREVIDLRQNTLPLLRLGQLFGLPMETSTPKRSYVVVVGMADKRMGIVVDDLLGQQDVVIKSLGRTLSFVRGIAGAADLGNQRTILVLDVGGLMSETLRGDAAIYV